MCSPRVRVRHSIRIPQLVAVLTLAHVQRLGVDAVDPRGCIPRHHVGLVALYHGVRDTHNNSFLCSFKVPHYPPPFEQRDFTFIKIIAYKWRQAVVRAFSAYRNCSSYRS